MGRRWLVAVVVLAVVAAAVAFGLTQRSRADDLEQEADERRAVATAASTFASALLSYDADDLDVARERVTALATPDFAAEYEDAFEGGLRAVIDQLNAVSTATVRDVFVSEVSGSSARAVVVIDASVTSDAGVRDLTGSYVQVELEKVGDQWLVSAASAVGAEAESVTAD